MSEKYTRVYHSTDLLYAETLPVIVMARAMQNDSGTGEQIAEMIKSR